MPEFGIRREACAKVLFDSRPDENLKWTGFKNFASRLHGLCKTCISYLNYLSVLLEFDFKAKILLQGRAEEKAVNPPAASELTMPGAWTEDTDEAFPELWCCLDSRTATITDVLEYSRVSPLFITLLDIMSLN